MDELGSGQLGPLKRVGLFGANTGLFTSFVVDVGNCCDLEFQTSNIEWGSRVFSTFYSVIKRVLFGALKDYLKTMCQLIMPPIVGHRALWVYPGPFYCFFRGCTLPWA